MTSDSGEPRTCIFCGASRLTKTHLIARRAIQQHLPHADGQLRVEHAWLDPQDGLSFSSKYSNQDGMNQQVKRACEPCNRDWMGGVENDVAADVIALAKGERVVLDEARAARLAVWATTVAVLRSTMDPGIPAITTADAHGIRQTSQVPEGWVVRLVYGEAKWGFQSRHQRITVDGLPTHATYFWIGSSAYLVTHPLVEQYLDRLKILGDAIQVLAPHGNYPISWPFAAQSPAATMYNLMSSLGRVQ